MVVYLQPFCGFLWCILFEKYRMTLKEQKCLKMILLFDMHFFVQFFPLACVQYLFSRYIVFSAYSK